MALAAAVPLAFVVVGLLSGLYELHQQIKSKQPISWSKVGSAAIEGGSAAAVGTLVVAGAVAIAGLALPVGATVAVGIAVGLLWDVLTDAEPVGIDDEDIEPNGEPAVAPDIRPPQPISNQADNQYSPMPPQSEQGSLGTWKSTSGGSSYRDSGQKTSDGSTVIQFDSGGYWSLSPGVAERMRDSGLL